MKSEIIVAPSILSADFCNLQRDCEKMLSFGADWLHVDIMDGHFVPNISIGLPVVESLRKCLKAEAFLDCHLMIENPELWVERFYRAGASSITFHLEATADPVSLARRIKSFGCHCGVSIKPGTAVETLSKDLLESVDMVLVMTVEPGFGGQKLIPQCFEKVRLLRSKFSGLIQVDGGVDESNFSELIECGADALVAGSSIFKSADPKLTIEKFKRA